MIPGPTAQKYRILIASIVILTVGVIVPQRLTNAGEQQSVIHQLRIYEIFDNNEKTFHDRFRDHAMWIMAKYDFKIVATWESKKDNRTEFVYLLEWPDVRSWQNETGGHSLTLFERRIEGTLARPPHLHSLLFSEARGKRAASRRDDQAVCEKSSTYAHVGSPLLFEGREEGEGFVSDPHKIAA